MKKVIGFFVIVGKILATIIAHGVGIVTGISVFWGIGWLMSELTDKIWGGKEVN